MHLEAQKRGGGPITAAVDHRRGLILLRDGSRALVRSVPIVDADMNMIVGVASRQELAPDLFYEVVANAAHPDRLARFKGKVVVIGYTRPRISGTFQRGRVTPGMASSCRPVPSRTFSAALRSNHSRRRRNTS